MLEKSKKAPAVEIEAAPAVPHRRPLSRAEKARRKQRRKSARSSRRNNR